MTILVGLIGFVLGRGSIALGLRWRWRRPARLGRAPELLPIGSALALEAARTPHFYDECLTRYKAHRHGLWLRRLPALRSAVPLQRVRPRGTPGG